MGIVQIIGRDCMSQIELGNVIQILNEKYCDKNFNDDLIDSLNLRKKSNESKKVFCPITKEHKEINSGIKKEKDLINYIIKKVSIFKKY